MYNFRIESEMWKCSFQIIFSVRGWWNVKLHTKKDVDVVFISGHPTRHEPRQLVLPLSSNEMVSPMKINQYLNQIKLDDYKTEG